MNHLDLFSGIGGFALAARWAGFTTVTFVERDSFCQRVLRKHWPHVPIHTDIVDFSWHDQVTVLTGGFPCQPFSVAGNRRGHNDDRYLWPEMLRIIRECKPSWIVAENVPGIIPMLDPILESLECENYTWQAYLVPASLIGAPHKRERIWIVAHANSERCNYGTNNRKGRHFQSNFDRNIKKIYTQWEKLTPQSWKTFDVKAFTDPLSKSIGERTTDINLSYY